MTIKTQERAIRDTILAALEGCEEPFEVLGPLGIDAWTISWREVVVRGYYKENGEFAWSAVNSRIGASTGGDVRDDPDDVIDRIEQVIDDPMQDAWVGTIDEYLPKNEDAVREMAVRAYEWVGAIND